MVNQWSRPEKVPLGVWICALLLASSGSMRMLKRPSPVWRSTAWSGLACSARASPSRLRNRPKPWLSSSPSSDRRSGLPVARRCLAASTWRDSSPSAWAMTARSALRSRTLASAPRGAASPYSRRRGLICSAGASAQGVLAGMSSSSCTLSEKCLLGCSAKAARARRWAWLSLSQAANQLASVRRSAERSLRPLRRSFKVAIAPNSCGMAARALARSSSAWGGSAPVGRNQPRRPRQRSRLACQRRRRSSLWSCSSPGAASRASRSAICRNTSSMRGASCVMSWAMESERRTRSPKKRSR